MKARLGRLGIPSFWITLGALVAIIALSRPAANQSGASASSSSPSPTPTVIGVMGVASRDAARLAPAAAQAAVCPTPNAPQGIDVSYYQGSIDWSQVAQSGRTFAYARAADGTTFVDPKFLTNYAGIRATGMKAGAYIFFRPEQDPSQQAYILISELDQAYFKPGDLAPVFDVELTDGVDPSTLVANLQTSINIVQQSLGVTPIIYTSWGFWNYSVNSTAFSGNPLWVANWGVSCPTVPIGWSSWVVWQYDDNSIVPGITVNVVDADQLSGPNFPVYLPRRQLLPFVQK
jgi:lysozyme